MNLILFEPDEVERPLPPSDVRSRHIRDVLRRTDGERFDCGIVNGPRGQGWVEAEDGVGLHLNFSWGEVPPPLDPIWLLVGLPRPQTARKILGDAATLGLTGIAFFPTDRGEASYASSHLWTSSEARRHLVSGAAQAFCTRLPECRLAPSMTDALDARGAMTTRVALDNYEALAPLSQTKVHGTQAILVVGPERGWSPGERDVLRKSGFALAHLGPRILRVETACIVGLTLLKQQLGLL